MAHLLAGAALFALALLAAVNWGGAPAQAGFPGQNGRIACQGLRGPDPVPPVPGVSRDEIFSVNPDGSDQRVLSNNAILDRDPAFSPDGTKIAFAAQRNNVAAQPGPPPVPAQPANTEIYVANNDGDLEGPDVKRLTFNDGTLANGTKSGLAATDLQPSWSPDGTQIVFHSGRETTFTDGGPSPARDFEIYTMSATEGEGEGGFLTRLTTNRGQDSIPDWSPDGTKIAFQSARAGGSFFNLEIFTMNVNGTEVTNVSNNPGTPDDPATPDSETSDAIDRDPDWSPDSSQIAFTSTRANKVPGNQNFEIYKVNRDGGNPTQLTANLSGDTPEGEPYKDHDDAAAWSPDGTRIVFSSSRTSETNDGESTTAFTMDSRVGESAGGVQPVGEVSSLFAFPKCDWQSLKAASPVSPTTQLPAPAGDDADAARLLPNLIRPGFARAVQTGRRSRSRRGRSASAVARVSQARGGRIVVRLRGRMVGNGGRPCGGRIKIGTRAGSRRVATRTARMGRNCRYSKKYSVAARRLPKRLRPRNRKLVLRIAVRFQGNSLLRGDLSPTKRVKVRR